MTDCTISYWALSTMPIRLKAEMGAVYLPKIRVVGVLWTRSWVGSWGRRRVGLVAVFDVVDLVVFEGWGCSTVVQSEALDMAMGGAARVRVYREAKGRSDEVGDIFILEIGRVKILAKQDVDIEWR